jgi:WD40 repeat protein
LKTFNKLCLCIGMMVILLGSLPFSTSAAGETELPLFNTLPMEIGGWSKFAVSPDGKLLFSGGGDNSYLWYLDSGRKKEIEQLRNFRSVTGVAFNPDGKLMAVAIDGSTVTTKGVMLFDSQSGSLLNTIEISTSGFVGPIHFSNDGKFLIAGLIWDRVSIIDMASYKEVYSVPKDEYIDIIRSHPGRSEFAITSPYGRSNNSFNLQIRDTLSGEIIKSLGNTLPQDKCVVFDMNYSPDGKYFIVSLNNNCGTIVYDAEKSYEQVAKLDQSGSISFSKDSTLAIIGDQVYPIEDKFEISYGLKIKNSKELIDPSLSILTPDGKYLITRYNSNSSNGLIVLDSSNLSLHLTGIRIIPETIALGLNESQALKIEGIYSDGAIKNLDGNVVKWTVKNFYMAEVIGNVLYSHANGSTELTAEYGGYKKTVPVVIAEYPSNLIATATTEGQVSFTWTGVKGTKDMIGYNLYRRSADESYGDVPLTDFPLQTTSYVDGNVDSNGQYYYIVKAVYANNVESRQSNEVSSTSREKRIVLQVNNPIMKVNDVSKEIDPGNGTTPVIYKGRTVLPVRSLIEELGGQLTFDNESQKLTINLNDKKIELWIGKNMAIVNGIEKSLDVAPVIINKRTMLPLRFIGEQLGLQLTWDGTTQTVELIL